jgi:leucyl-tRNA synthetase
MVKALPDGGTMRAFTPGPNALTPRSPFAGMANAPETVRSVVAWVEEHGIGRGRVNYRLRDWLISRQRYWGAPIPIVYCAACGEVPVPDDLLPVVLPDVERYEPSGTGESPLAAMPEFVQTTCPRCGAAARRETDTMGGFACSSWYFLRFADPQNAEVFADPEMIRAWLPVNMYTGGAEHAVMHLLYARFWTMVMHDAGVVDFTEPFSALRSQGAMLAYTPGRRPRAGEVVGEDDDGERIVDWIVLRPEELATFPADQIVWRWVRMSKSKGNVVPPDAVVAEYGADSLRIFEMFVAPFEDNVKWNEDGVSGALRFVHRFWRWMVAAMGDAGSNGPSLWSDADRAIRRKLHQTVRKVGDDIEQFRFNTAVAALMEMVNELYLWKPPDAAATAGAHNADLVAEAVEKLILLIAPFAPHLADELWERSGHVGSTYRAAWPEWDPSVAADETITIVVQVNGKLRDRLTVPLGTDEGEVRAQALASTKVLEATAGKTIRNVVCVPGRLVNIVVG